MPDLTDIFAPKGNFVARLVAGEMIIVPVAGYVGDLESIFTLNEVGAAIWARLDGNSTAGAIADAVCEEYDVTRPEALADTLAFLSDLQAAGIVEATKMGDGR